MSDPTEVNTQVMNWKPKLIRLTMIGNPDWDGGKPQVCFLDPAVIVSLSEGFGAFSTRDDPPKRHPDVRCTAVFFCHGTLHVLESAEEVARLRDEALGFKASNPKLGLVK